jgi:hypothetical protein
MGKRGGAVLFAVLALGILILEWVREGQRQARRHRQQPDAWHRNLVSPGD